MAALPSSRTRQTLFFTATWPKSVRKTASKFMRRNNKEDTVEIFLDESTAKGELVANKSIQQTFIESQDDTKDEKLYNLLCKIFDDDEKNKASSSSIVIF